MREFGDLKDRLARRVHFVRSGQCYLVVLGMFFQVRRAGHGRFEAWRGVLGVKGGHALSWADSTRPPKNLRSPGYYSSREHDPTQIVPLLQPKDSGSVAYSALHRTVVRQ